MKQPVTVLALSASMLAFTSMALASDAHEHGIADLSVALEARKLEVMLSVPADSLVGFEHKATRKADIDAVKRAEALLRKAYDIVVLPKAAACVLKSAQVEHSLLDTDGHKHNEADHKHDDHDHKHDEANHKHDDHEHKHDEAHHKHDDHDHKHDEAHHKHDDHDHKHDEAHHKHDDHDHKHDDHEHKHGEENHPHEAHQHGHADVNVTYQFQCMAPEQLNQITFGGFKAFPAIEQVRYQLISSAGQTGGTLSPAAASIALSK